MGENIELIVRGIILESVLVSVIMANYKTKIEYLREAIESILNQTYSNFELIIVDDCSQDESLTYIQSLKDPRVRVYVNETNSGPAVTRNKGFLEARGKYIAIMDSDDISMPTRLEKQVAYMENNPDVIVCGTWFEKFGVENKTRKPIIDDFEMYRCQLLFSDTPITLCSPSAMIRKSMLDDNSIRYDETLLKTEDYGLWVACSKVARFYIIKDVLIKYRTHVNQTSIIDKSEQCEYANLISRRQLQDLGIEFIEEEKRWRYDIVPSYRDYLHFYQWIIQLERANTAYGIYNQDAFKRYLEIKLSNAIKRLSSLDKIKILFGSNARSVKLFIRLTKSMFDRRIKKQRV